MKLPNWPTFLIRVLRLIPECLVCFIDLDDHDHYCDQHGEDVHIVQVFDGVARFEILGLPRDQYKRDNPHDYRDKATIQLPVQHDYSDNPANNMEYADHDSAFAHITATGHTFIFLFALLHTATHS